MGATSESRALHDFYSLFDIFHFHTGDARDEMCTGSIM